MWNSQNAQGSHGHNPAQDPPRVAIWSQLQSGVSQTSSCSAISMSVPQQEVNWSSSQMFQQELLGNQRSYGQSSQKQPSAMGIPEALLPHHLGFIDKQANILKRGHDCHAEQSLQAINQTPQPSLHASATINRDKFGGQYEQNASHAERDKAASSSNLRTMMTEVEGPLQVESFGKGQKQRISFPAIPDQNLEHQTLCGRSEIALDGSTDVIRHSDVSDAFEAMECALRSISSRPIVPEEQRETCGPLFDIPYFSGNMQFSNNGSNSLVTFDIDDFFSSEDIEMLTRGRTENLESGEGEIAVLGQSCVNNTDFGSWLPEHNDHEDQLALTQRRKRTCSAQIQPGHTAETDHFQLELPVSQFGPSSSMVSSADHNNEAQYGAEPNIKSFKEPVTVGRYQTDSASRAEQTLSSSKGVSFPMLQVPANLGQLRNMSSDTDDNLTCTMPPPEAERNVKSSNEPLTMGLYLTDSASTPEQTLVSASGASFSILPVLSNLDHLGLVSTNTDDDPKLTMLLKSFKEPAAIGHNLTDSASRAEKSLASSNRASFSIPPVSANPGHRGSVAKGIDGGSMAIMPPPGARPNVKSFNEPVSRTERALVSANRASFSKHLISANPGHPSSLAKDIDDDSMGTMPPPRAKPNAKSFNEPARTEQAVVSSNRASFSILPVSARLGHLNNMSTNKDDDPKGVKPPGGPELNIKSFKEPVAVGCYSIDSASAPEQTLASPVGASSSILPVSANLGHPSSMATDALDDSLGTMPPSSPEPNVKSFKEPVARPEETMASSDGASFSVLPVSENLGHQSSVETVTYDDSMSVMPPSGESRDLITLSASRSIIVLTTKMSEKLRRKCKNVISEIQRQMHDECNPLAPLLAHMVRSETSVYRINLSGLDLLDFQKICRHLDEDDYDIIGDFVKDVHSMINRVEVQFGFSDEVKAEVEEVRLEFSNIMKTTFPDLDINEVTSTSGSCVGSTSHPHLIEEE